MIDDPYAGTVRLRLETGCDVQALVQVEAGDTKRAKCLLLHGNPGSLLDWQRVAPRLSSVADVVVIDLPGFGKSPRSDQRPESLSLNSLAAHVAAVADALAWHEPFFVVAHSHGGGVAQTVAARYPDRIAGLVLVASLGSPAHGGYRLLALPGAGLIARAVGWLFRSPFRALSRAVLGAILKDIFSPEAVPPAKLDAQLALFSARPEILLSMVHLSLGGPCQQLFDSAPNIHCPVLFLHGDEDALVPAKYAKRVHERIVTAGGRSQFQLVPRAGHLLIEYQAAGVAQSILRFLGG